MSTSTPFSFGMIDSLDDVNADAWDACANPVGRAYNPTVSHRYLLALEQSGSAGPETGWRPLHALAHDANGTLKGVLPLYLKGHSYGEYVFDQGWAEGYERAGGQYYPKLLAAIPFTPVPGPRLLLQPGDQQEKVASFLLQQVCAFAERNRLSSLHVNFIETGQLPLFKDPPFLLRRGHQFHFSNDNYQSFDDFLLSLSSRKRKGVRKERRQAVAAGLEIRHMRGEGITSAHWDAFYRFYMDTGARKWGTPYLTRACFALWGETMADDILLVFAMRDEQPVAGALFLIGSETLFGRYWGALEHHPFLHFELCYYQGIEFAIENGLLRVEAGAGGEHKLARGFLPSPTTSAHFLPDPSFRDAVGTFLSSEERYMVMEKEILDDHSPFKKTEP